MSTRLLVLGAVHIMQPVSGYDIRRELTTWQLDDWTNFQSGSVYSSLRTLERDGMIRGAQSGDSRARAGRIDYSMTPEGNKEFERLLRTGWWKVEFPMEPLLPAMALMTFMERKELIAATEARVPQLEAQIAQFEFAKFGIRDGASGADGEIPEHVRETFEFLTRRLRAEVDWLRGFVKRLRDGAYTFSDEPGFPDFGADAGSTKPVRGKRERRTKAESPG